MTPEQHEALGQRLTQLIQAGDTIETRLGFYPCTMPMSSRFIRGGRTQYSVTVLIAEKNLQLPIEHIGIISVWRGETCIYQRGETAYQLSLFD